MKPRDQRALSVDQIIAELRPKLVAVPGIMAFLQNPPPITISGQFTTSVYQMTLQSVNLKEIYEWAPRWSDKMRTLPGFVDVNSDLQIASPQVMVDIDRDRALALGVTPEQIQNALLQRVRRSPGVDHLRAGESVRGDSRSGAAVSAHAGCAVEAVRAVVEGQRWCRSTPWCDVRAQSGPLSVNHFGQLPGGDDSFNLQPGFSLGEAAQQVERRDPRTAHAGEPSPPASRAR